MPKNTTNESNVILDKIYNLVGLRKVKEEITRVSEYADFIKLRRENGFTDDVQPFNMIFTGHPGTGKNTVALLLSLLLKAQNVLSKGDVVTCDALEFVNENPEIIQKNILDIFKKAMGNILFIDNIGDLFDENNPNSPEMLTLSTIFNLISQNMTSFVVVISDETDDISVLSDVIPSLKDLFPRQLFFEDYSPQELLEIANKKLKVLQYRFSPLAEEKFLNVLKHTSLANKIDFTNGSFIDEQLRAAIARLTKRIMANKHNEFKRDDLMIIKEDDILTEKVTDPAEFLKRLNNMVGHCDLKKNIMQHLNYVWFTKERQNRGFSDVMPAQNMIFGGNSGTGKLTIARMMAEVYNSAGILDNAKLIIQDARSLNEGTGLQPNQIVDTILEAGMGSIVYLDKSEFLMQTSFGGAVLDYLRAVLLEDSNNNCIVILSGALEYMEKLALNYPAFKLVFPNYFEFKDYTAESLFIIATEKFKEKNFYLSLSADKLLKKLIMDACKTKKRHTGNVVVVNKIVDLTIKRMSERIMNRKINKELSNSEFVTVKTEDLPSDMFTKFTEDDIFDEKSIEDALKELDSLIGQKKLKAQVHNFVSLVRHYNKDGIKLSSKISLQWSFTGNSGIEKIQVAKIIAKLYKAMGILPKSTVIEFKVEKLIGMEESVAIKFIGDSLVKSAGGIFFFDEDSPLLFKERTFRDRIKAILMNQIAERPGSWIVISAVQENFANLNNEMDNPSDLTNVLTFEDYSKIELMEMLESELKAEKLRLTPSAKHSMEQFIDKIFETGERVRSASRIIRILKEIIVRNCIQRIVDPDKPDRLIPVGIRDVLMFDDKFISSFINERKKIGF